MGSQSAELGYISVRARYYDPAIGRFISEDPAGDGGNWYAYCGENPTNGVDQTGEFTLPEVLEGATGSASLEAMENAADAAAQQWGERAIQRILYRFADEYADFLYDLQWKSAEFRGVAGGTWRLDIIGIDGLYRVAVDLTHDVPHVNMYCLGEPHFTAISKLF